MVSGIRDRLRGRLRDIRELCLGWCMRWCGWDAWRGGGGGGGGEGGGGGGGGMERLWREVKRDYGGRNGGGNLPMGLARTISTSVHVIRM